MARLCQHQINKRVASEVILGVVFLLCGCVIYLLFRSRSVNIFQWCSVVGLSEPLDSLRHAVHEWQIPDFLIFSLPDGLYCASYILITDAIWYNDNGIVKYFIISFIPVVAVSDEIMQLFNMVHGTFDFNDLICYSIPLIAYVLIITTNNKSNPKIISL